MLPVIFLGVTPADRSRGRVLLLVLRQWADLCALAGIRPQRCWGLTQHAVIFSGFGFHLIKKAGRLARLRFFLHFVR